MLHFEMDVWKTAMDFAVEMYSQTAKLPQDERFGLTSQMRRAAVSIPSNIAEGAGRESRRDHRHFLIQARGSLNEISTQIELCKRLDYFSEDDAVRLAKQILQIRRLLAGTIKHLGGG